MWQFPAPNSALGGLPIPPPNSVCACGLGQNGCLCCTCGLQNDPRWSRMPLNSLAVAPPVPRFSGQYCYKGVDQPIVGNYQLVLGQDEEELSWHASDANVIWWLGSRSGPEVPPALAVQMGRDPLNTLRQVVGLRSRGAQDLLEAAVHIECTTTGGRNWMAAVGVRVAQDRGLPAPIRYVLRSASITADPAVGVNRSLRPMPADSEIMMQSLSGAPGPVNIGTGSGLGDVVSVFERTSPGAGIDARSHQAQDDLAGNGFSAYSVLHECRVPRQVLGPNGEEEERASGWLYNGLRGFGPGLAEIVVPRSELVNGSCILRRTVRADALPAWVRYFINRYEARKGVVPQACCPACWDRIGRVAECWLTRGLGVSTGHIDSPSREWSGIQRLLQEVV